MNVFKYASQFFLKLDILSKIFYIVVVLLSVVTIAESLYSVVIFNKSQTVESKVIFSLPKYSGNCPDVVETADKIFIDSRAFEESALGNIAEDKLQYKQIYLRLRSVFQLAQFCEDAEAQGRILYIGASIEIAGGFRGTEPLKQVVRLAASYFNEAQHFGYNDNHPSEAYWLKERILRNAYRANIEVNTTKNHELIIKGS